MKADRCRAVAKSGNPCGATVVAPSGMCAWHAPEWAARRREWSRKGGENRSNRARAKRNLPDGLTPAELQGYLALALRGVLGGKVQPAVGNCVAALARSIVTVREATELEERIADLESRAGVGRLA